MIRFSKKSWHYKLATFLEVKTHNTSLCKYFWTIVFRSLFLLAVSITALVMYSMPLWYDSTDYRSWIAWIATAVLVGLVIVVDFIPKSINHIKRKRKLRNKEPSLFKEWIRAKKEKICPFIEFEDD